MAHRKRSVIDISEYNDNGTKKAKMARKKEKRYNEDGEIVQYRTYPNIIESGLIDLILSPRLGAKLLTSTANLL